MLSLIRPPTIVRTWCTSRRRLGTRNNSTREPVSEQDRRAAARAKRKQKIGLAKAVDHHNLYPHVYKPGPPFEARTGLPKGMIPGDCGDSATKLFTVLGIETSCDDTGAAVVRSDGEILGEALASQAELHEPWGGVVPSLARDAHTEAVDRVIRQALERAQIDMNEVDAVAVTVGPGLEICLRVGVQTAVDLATKYDKPFVGVHHLEAHILMARLPLKMQTSHVTSETDRFGAMEVYSQSQQHPRAIAFPFLSLLVSGGHCQLLRCHGIGRYEILGGTVDDSLGEAFDKTARLLGLPVGGGGGPAVERLAREAPQDALSIPLTVPMRNRHDCDFSYAGLKTNVRRAAEQLVREHNEGCKSNGDEVGTIETPDQLPVSVKATLAASFQNVAIQHIEDRLKRAMTIVSNGDVDGEEHSRINTLAVVGGVAANLELRSRLERLCQERGWNMVVPPPRLCTDQGA